MANIIDEILKHLPREKISTAVFEGANIVLYTIDREFFLQNNGVIKKVVDQIKKRIELRPDPSITTDQKNTEKIIKDAVPDEAGLSNIIFDPKRSRVIIEAEKPGLAIGKQGSILREIREKTLWVPFIRRTAAIKSQLIENIRSVLYENSEYRRKFLDEVGHRIYDGWRSEKRNEWIRLSVLGGGRQVGRSCLLLMTPESRVLLDCGIDVSTDTDAYPHLEAPEFKIDELDAVILSHAHIDHSGLIPFLFKMGYRGPVYCTAPTRDISSLLLIDMLKIAQGERDKEPIYTIEDVKEMVKHTITLSYEEVTDVTPDIRLTLYNSGHMVGSAMAHLHIGNGLHNLLYTGDMKFGFTGLLDPSSTDFPRLETVVTEATYGGKENVLPPPKEADAELAEVIIRTIERGGKVFIPTLGTGRAQETMVMIEQMVRQGKLEKIPVYIDGMVWDVTAIHTAYPEYLKSNVRKSIFHKDANPFLSDIFRRVGSKKERKEVIEEKGPCVILATSGMLVGGPSVEYLRALADNPKNTLVFSSYQAAGTLGHRIQSGERELIFREGNRQEIVEVKMEIFKLEITGHSDRKQLMNFLYRCQPRPKKAIIVHGESSRCLDLASSIHKSCKIETLAPRNLDVLRIR